LKLLLLYNCKASWYSAYKEKCIPTQVLWPCPTTWIR